MEEAAGIEVAEQDGLFRALLLELERMHNHIADLGALANGVGFGIDYSVAESPSEGHDCLLHRTPR